MVDWVLGIVGGLLYPLFSILFVLINVIQSIFYAFAGIGDMSFGLPNTAAWEGLDQITSGNSGGTTDTGLIYYLFNNTLIKNLLISIMLLALVLVIVFTVMAFIKNIYSAKPKGWKEIVGNAIKGLANFIFIPVCCLLGVWLGNILLNAVNGATSGLSGSSDMARKLFIAAAYNANEFRSGKVDENGVPWDQQIPTNETVDDVFEHLKGYTWKLKYLGTDEEYDFSRIEYGRTNAYYAEIIDDIYANTNISIYEWRTVEVAYSLWEINYLLLGAGGVFMLYALCSLAFAMVRRMFFLVVLFVISPAVCALYPLDEGKAVGSWKGKFVEQVLSAYGAVAGMNIFFALVPLIDNLHLGTSQFWGHVTAIGFVDDIVQLFVLICGLLVVKELIGLISGFVGGEDAYGKGGSMFSSARSASKKYVGGAIKKTGGAFYRSGRTAKVAWDEAQKGGKGFLEKLGAASGGFWGSLGKQGLDGAMSGLEYLGAESGLWDKKYGEEMTKSYYAYLNAQKKKKDERDFGKYGEVAASKAATDYANAHQLGTGHERTRRSSELMGEFNDDMRKVIFDSFKGKPGAENAELTAMGIEGAYKMKVDDVMGAVGVVDNIIDLFNNMNKLATAAAGAFTPVAAILSSTSLSDEERAGVTEAMTKGRKLLDGEFNLSAGQTRAFNDYIEKANAAKAAQDRFNNYAESHADTINGNKVLDQAVSIVQASIQTQQNSGVYAGITSAEMTGLRDATVKLTETIIQQAQKTQDNAKKAKENAGKDAAKGDKK